MLFFYFGLWPSDDCYRGEGVALGFSRGGFNFRFCRRLVILLWAYYLISLAFLFFLRKMRVLEQKIPEAGRR